jgi:hypothetical protein
MSFSDPILTGAGNLIRVSEQSDNFVTGSSGWQITRAGDAEFSGITIRGATTEDSVYLLYNGSPALGNLILSISANNGTDPYGNAYESGLVLYQAGNAKNYIRLASVSGGAPGISLNVDSSLYGKDAEVGPWDSLEGGHEHGQLLLSSPAPTTGTQATLALNGSSLDGNQAGYASLNVPLQVTGETWHPIPYAAQWSDAPGFQTGQYRMNPDGSVSLRGRAVFTSNGTTGLNAAAGTLLCTLPSAYRPAAAQGWPVPCYGSPTLSSNRVPSLVIGQTGAGQITIFNVASAATSGTAVSVDLSGTYWL